MSGRRFKIALGLSVLLHLVFLFIYKPLSTFSGLLALANPDQTQDQPLVFEFEEPAEKPKELVETPEDARVNVPPRDAQFLSDKNARAQDLYTGEDLSEGLPYSAGQTPYRLFAGGGNPGEQTLPQQEQSNQTQDERVRPSQGDDPERSGDVALYSRRGTTPQRQRFNKQVLTGQSSQPSATPGSFSDDITFDQRASDVSDFGGVSLNTYAWDFAPYILYMKNRLKSNIYPPPAFYQMGAISGEVVLTFKVNLDGSVSDLRLISYQGHNAFVATSMNAVKASSPFRKLPEDFPEKDLQLTWTFIYSILR